MGLCLDSLELISFKTGMVLDTTKLYSIIPVLMTLTFTQDSRYTEKQEFCNHSVLELHEVTKLHEVT